MKLPGSDLDDLEEDEIYFEDQTVETVKWNRNGLKKSNGQTRYATSGLEADKVRTAGVHANLTDSFEMLRLNHEAIETVGMLLNKSQPPIPGKIEVRWWTVSGVTKPIVICYQRGRSNPKIAKPKKIETVGLVRRACSRGGFATNYAETVELLKILEDLIDSRNKLINIYSDFNRKIAQYKLHDHANYLNAMKFKVFEQLEDKIDEKTVDNR
jgi:hypothetical protein